MARPVLLGVILAIGTIWFPGRTVMSAATQTLTISDVPATLDESGEAAVTVSYTCSSCTTDFYLRAVYFTAGSTNYFGYEKNNGGEWIHAPGSQCIQYYKVAKEDISPEGTWSGKLVVRPDLESSYYNGPGEYQFKIGRYTPSCSSASLWSSEYTIAITGPTSTPTPTASPTVRPATPTHPDPTNTPVPYVRSSAEPTIVVSAKAVKTSESGILGVYDARESTGSSGTKTTAPEIPTSQASSLPFVISFLCIGTGMGLIASVLAWQKTDLWKTHRHASRHSD